MKCFAYLRCSGQSQVAGDSFPRQGAAIAEYAEANGLDVIGWFEEQGVSGTSDWDERREWTRMITEILSNGVRTVIVEKMDRLARDFGVQEYILRDLRKRDITLISTAEPDLGNSEPSRVLIRQMLGVLAQYDRAQLTAKMAAAKKRIRDSGRRCDGRKPFGHRAGELDALARMRELRAEGIPFDHIAERLNAEGVRTRTGKRWHGLVVNRILRRAA